MTLEPSILTRKIPIYFVLFNDAPVTLARHKANSEPSAAAEGRQDEGRHNVRRGVAISAAGTSNVARTGVSHVRPASASAMVHGLLPGPLSVKGEPELHRYIALSTCVSPNA